MFDYEHDSLLKVPSSWKMIPLKYTGEIDNSGVWGEDKQFENSIAVKVPTTKNISKDGKFDVDEMQIRYVSVQEYQKYICKIGDIIIVKSSGSSDNVISGKCGYIDSNDEFAFGNFLMRVRPNPEVVQPKFVYFFLKSHVTRERILRMVSTTTYPNLKVGEYISSPISVPPLKEQKLISRYLDKKTEQIDRLVEKIQKKIEILKEQQIALINQCVTKGLDPSVEMKDSGVEWIGEIPKHWDIKKLKYISRVSFSTVDRQEYDEEKKVSICHYTDVYKNEYIESSNNLPIGTCSENEFKKFSLLDGDILLTKDSESPEDIGIPTLVIGNIDNTVCGYHLAVIRMRSPEFIPAFIYRFIESRCAKDYFYTASNGITRFGLGKCALENILIALPPENEQKKISNKIASINTKISTTLQKMNTKIELLHEYRQSVISSAVIGKFRVTEDML